MTKPVYNFALSDGFHPPMIHRVDLRQSATIRIQVHPDDDANAPVEGVQVIGLDEEGKVTERESC